MQHSEFRKIYIFLLILTASFIFNACGGGGGGGGSSSSSSNAPTLQSSPTIFDDTLSDNKNLWFTGDSEFASRDIANGVMTLESLSLEAASWTFHYLAELDYTQDFLIEASINKVSGSETEPFGLIWGAEDFDDAYFFLIYGDGNFIYPQRVNGEWVNVIGRSEASSVSTGNSSNVLQVQNSGSALQLFVNNAVVGLGTYAQPPGKLVGIYTQDGVHIQLDRLVVKQESASLLGTWKNTNSDTYYVFSENNQFQWFTEDAGDCSVSDQLTLDHRRIRFSSTTFSAFLLENGQLREYFYTESTLNNFTFESSSLPAVCSASSRARTHPQIAAPGHSQTSPMFSRKGEHYQER